MGTGHAGCAAAGDRAADAVFMTAHAMPCRGHICEARCRTSEERTPAMRSTATRCPGWSPRCSSAAGCSCSSISCQHPMLICCPMVRCCRSRGVATASRQTLSTTWTLPRRWSGPLSVSSCSHRGTGQQLQPKQLPQQAQKQRQPITHMMMIDTTSMQAYMASITAAGSYVASAPSDHTHRCWATISSRSSGKRQSFSQPAASCLSALRHPACAPVLRPLWV